MPLGSSVTQPGAAEDRSGPSRIGWAAGLGSPMKKRLYMIFIAPAMFLFAFAQSGNAQLPQIAPSTPAPAEPSCSANPAFQGKSAEPNSARDVSLARLVAIYNEQARGIRSLVTGIEMVATPGRSYGEEAKHSHEVGGMLIAQRPASLRLLAEVPFAGKRLFDLASDGKTFQMLIPSRHEFLIGQDESTRHSSKPFENLRPRDILDAMIWPELSDDSVVRLNKSIRAGEEPYRLTVMRTRGEDWEADRTIFLDRRTIRIQKIEIYGPNERLVSEIRYAEWKRVPPEAGGSSDACFPRHIWINRPEEDYQLEMLVTRIGLNQEISMDRFHIQPQSGVQLIYLDAVSASPKP